MVIPSYELKPWGPDGTFKQRFMDVYSRQFGNSSGYLTVRPWKSPFVIGKPW
jgi:hypothetical protein